MSDLSEGLRGIGFCNIVIVDDTLINIDAARKAGEELKGINFNFCQSAKEAVEYISENLGSIDLIISDLKMETDEAGLLVVEEGFNNGIYVIVASGGYEHSNSPVTKISPDINGVDGDKGDSETWIKIFNAIIKSAKEHTILKTFLLAREAGVMEKSQKDSPFPLGEHAKIVIGGYFKYVV